jgi:hypothetical protein
VKEDMRGIRIAFLRGRRENGICEWMAIENGRVVLRTPEPYDKWSTGLT